jgi:hypothetical protein
MRGKLLVAGLSALLLVILISPNILMAQPVETEHSIVVDERGSMEVKPLVRPRIACRYQSIEVLKKEKDHQILSIKYAKDGEIKEAVAEIKGDLRRRAEINIDVEGKKYSIDVEKTQVFSMGFEREFPVIEQGRFVGRSLDISLVKLSGNISVEYYLLNYSVTNPRWNLSIITMLLPRGEAYDAFTAVVYSPAEKRVTSLELVNLSGGITLSRSYMTLSNVAENLSKVYERGNKTVREQLSYGYKVMAMELKHLANLVNKVGMDRPISSARALISDEQCEAVCTAITTVVCYTVCYPVTGFVAGFFCGVLCGTAVEPFCEMVCYGDTEMEEPEIPPGPYP